MQAVRGFPFMRKRQTIKHGIVLHTVQCKLASARSPRHPKRDVTYAINILYVFQCYWERTIAKADRLIGKEEKHLSVSEQVCGICTVHIFSNFMYMYIHSCKTIPHTHFLSYASNFTTNLAESWMHVRTEFKGGNVINQSQSGSWQAGTGLRANEGPEWGPRTWETVTAKAANPVFAAASAEKAWQVEKDRKRKATDKAKASRRASQYAKTNDDSLQARSDYAQHDNGSGVRDMESGVAQAYFRA